MNEAKRKELETKFKAIFPQGTKEQLESFIKANTPAEVIIPNACRIDDPGCEMCGS